MPNIVHNIFSKKSSSKRKKTKSEANLERSPETSTANIQAPEKLLPTPARSTDHFEALYINIGYAQSIGVRRETNEDSLFTLSSNLNSNGITKTFGLFTLADGMGGHEAGEVASQLAVEKTSAYIIDKLFLPSISNSNHQLDSSIQEVLREAVIRAHQAIRHTAEGSGTTLTAALVLGDQLTIAHIGDSRAYLIEPDWRIQLLTHDHSLVKRLEEIGQISIDEASRHPRRNLLYRALGQGDVVEPDITSYHIFPGQMLLLCTDGLWGVVNDAEILQLIQVSKQPQNICQSLVDAANEAGGPDNISVIFVRFPG